MNDDAATPEEQATADVNQDGTLTMDDDEAFVDALVAANTAQGCFGQVAMHINEPSS